MKAENLLNECLANIPNDISIEIDLSFDIANRIDTLLSNRKISQKDFAIMMGKKESEISKWLKGSHNFTLRTIAKITDVLNEPIIEVAEIRPKNNEFIFINIDSFAVSKKSKPIAIQNKLVYTSILQDNCSFSAISKTIN